MFITIINDCQDDNARARQLTRVSTLFKVPANFVSVKNDLEAAGNIIDILDASQKKTGAVLVNVAPRNGSAKHWKNGTPFAYFYYGKTLALASVDGLTLSLVKKLKLTKFVNILDLEKSVKLMEKKKKLSTSEVGKIINTQFRSFEFLPRAASWLTQGYKLPFEKISIEKISDAPNAIWWIDNFGNCKTTVLSAELAEIKLIKKLQKLPCYPRLKDLPDNKTGLIAGSSGINNNRFVEIMTQGDSTAKKLKLKSGEVIAK
ncbi:MAG: hypothetical protein Q8Q23_02260 [bacterium]|nr:hypothetical protein [bacterium]